jgi:ABC-type transport system involved in multi-copper enzyme maturation permease subunit
MEDRGVLTKILAVAGTVLVWLPILFTVLTGIIGTIASRVVRFDYLMPAELFPVVLVGGVLLLRAAYRARSQQKPIGWGLLAAVVFLFGGQAIAVVTGLASGAREAAGWPFVLALGLIFLYTLAVIGIGIAGVSLVRKLYSAK